MRYIFVLITDSLVKPAPLTGSPAGPVDVTVSRPLHAAVRLADAPSEESSAGVAGNGPVVKVGGGGTRADRADSRQLPLEYQHRQHQYTQYQYRHNLHRQNQY